MSEAWEDKIKTMVTWIYSSQPLRVIVASTTISWWTWWILFGTRESFSVIISWFFCCPDLMLLFTVSRSHKIICKDNLIINQLHPVRIENNSSPSLEIQVVKTVIVIRMDSLKDGRSVVSKYPLMLKIVKQQLQNIRLSIQVSWKKFETLPLMNIIILIFMDLHWVSLSSQVTTKQSK